MKQVLLMIAVVMVGCAKENPPRPVDVPEPAPEKIPPRLSDEAKERFFEEAKRANLAREEYEHAMEEWWGNLVVCLHCGSDLAKKGRKFAPSVGRIRTTKKGRGDSSSPFGFGALASEA
jgi:hypothetical protein